MHFWKDQTFRIVNLVEVTLGDKTYKSKHHLLWTFKELVELCNADSDDESDEISYYLRSTVEVENHIFKFGNIAEDDC